jgi:phage tail sheath protein FI
MPVQPTYPGVYITETASGVHTVAGVSTSVTGFVGRAKRGPVNDPSICFNFGEFSRRFGGLWVNGPLSYSVDDFFANGGSQAVVVRLFKPNAPNDTGVAALSVGNLDLVAANPGDWGNKLKAEVTYTADVKAAEAIAAKYGVTPNDLFDLALVDEGANTREVFRNLTTVAGGGARRADRVLIAESNLVRVKLDNANNPILQNARPANGAAGTGAGGNDGAALIDTDFIGAENLKTGFHALLKTDIFNLLVIPPDERGADVPSTVWEKAAKFCADRRAFLIIDPLAAGRVVWGARTLRGADQLADEYKYLPVRRLALFIEESLYRGTQGVVFEPNDEPLWAQVRLNVGAFMQGCSARAPSRAPPHATPTS